LGEKGNWTHLAESRETCLFQARSWSIYGTDAANCIATTNSLYCMES